MLRVFRRCRTLALTLLLAAPGLGGTWLSVAHPCPVDMPWLAQGGHGAHGAPASHGHPDAPADFPSSCNCVSACHSGAAALLSIAAGQMAFAAVAGWNVAPSAPSTDTPVQARLRRHPPATAPPLA